MNAQESSIALLDRVVTQGDLATLRPEERLWYYKEVCQSLGLNPLTKPLEYISLNNRLTLYIRRDGTDQLRKRHKVSTTITAREVVNDTYVVSARATEPGGRHDESIGAVSIKGLVGDNLANAMMKAETKAKRRVTLSIVGLGWLDETEIETVASVQTVAVDAETGEIVEPGPRNLLAEVQTEKPGFMEGYDVRAPEMHTETAVAQTAGRSRERWCLEHPDGPIRNTKTKGQVCAVTGCGKKLMTEEERDTYKAQKAFFAQATITHAATAMEGWDVDAWAARLLLGVWTDGEHSSHDAEYILRTVDEILPSVAVSVGDATAQGKAKMRKTAEDKGVPYEEKPDTWWWGVMRDTLVTRQRDLEEYLKASSDDVGRSFDFEP